jgi:hypothetical protein
MGVDTLLVTSARYFCFYPGDKNCGNSALYYRVSIIKARYGVAWGPIK